MACQCTECAEHGGPNPTIMKARFGIFGLQFLVAFVGLIKERSWGALAALIAAFSFFATVPRTLICCRCEGYGNMCYSLYLGKITSMYLPKIEDKEVSMFGAGLEAITLGIIVNAPAIGLRKNKKYLIPYLLLASLTFWTQFGHACRHCAQNATDWKQDCPSAKVARLFFGPGREVAL